MTFLGPSYRAYCTDTAVQRTFPRWTTSLAESPTGKGALRLAAYQRAPLSEPPWVPICRKSAIPQGDGPMLFAWRNQVRSDYRSSVFLIDLWNAVWQASLAPICGFHSGLALTGAVQPRQNGVDSRRELDKLHSVWANGWFGTSLRHATACGNLQFGLAVYVLPEGAELGLSFWGADARTIRPDTNFGEGWREHEIEEGWIVCR